MKILMRIGIGALHGCVFPVFILGRTRHKTTERSIEASTAKMWDGVVN